MKEINSFLLIESRKKKQFFQFRKKNSMKFEIKKSFESKNDLKSADFCGWIEKCANVKLTDISITDINPRNMRKLKWQIAISL